MQVRRWLPGQPTHIGRHDWPDEGDDRTHLRLRSGSIVVLDRQAWRVLEINDYPGDWWPESYEKAWGEHVELWWHANELRRANGQAVKPAPERAEFYKRPVILVLRSENLSRSARPFICTMRAAFSPLPPPPCSTMTSGRASWPRAGGTWTRYVRSRPPNANDDATSCAKADVAHAPSIASTAKSVGGLTAYYLSSSA